MKRTVLFLLVFILTMVWSVPLKADELSDYEKKKKQIDSSIKATSSEIKETKKEKTQKQNEAANLRKQEEKAIEEHRKLLDDAQSIAELNEMLAVALEDSIANYNEQRELFKVRLKVMYQKNNLSYIQTLIESKSVTDFLERLKLMETVASKDKQLIEELEAAKKDVEYKKQLAEEQKEEAERKVKDKENKIQEIKSSRASVETDISELDAEIRQLEKELDRLNKESEAVRKKIEKLMSEAEYSGGVMKWPLPGHKKISSDYGMRYHPILKKNKMHTGIDIPASTGTSIVAAASGTVIVAGWEGAYGNAVIIDHGGKIATLYGHCSKLLVKVGDKVKAGETIAKVGTTGYSTGPHLHFEVIKDGKTTDPKKYVSAK